MKLAASTCIAGTLPVVFPFSLFEYSRFLSGVAYSLTLLSLYPAGKIAAAYRLLTVCSAGSCYGLWNSSSGRLTETDYKNGDCVEYPWRSDRTMRRLCLYPQAKETQGTGWGYFFFENESDPGCLLLDREAGINPDYEGARLWDEWDCGWVGRVDWH